jgi:hypothetical protein
MDGVKLGQLVPDDVFARDAVHVAVIPMVALRVLEPGQRMVHGIVDPFLPKPVQPGQRFYLFLFPGTVTGMTHAWQHPAFPAEPEPAPKRRSEADVWAAIKGWELTDAEVEELQK